jgi:AcrR family transcriptional regulator
MDDIVQESGLSKGALYWYFDSKDAIILGLVERVFAAEIGDAEALVAADGPAGERLLEFARVANREFRQFQSLMPVVYDLAALMVRKRSARDILSRYYQRYQHLLAQIVQQGVATGEFAPVDPDTAALMMISLFEGLGFIWFVNPQMVDWDALIELPMRTLLDGLRQREG